MKLSMLLTCFLVLVLLPPYTNATCNCNKETLKVAFKSNKYVIKAKATATKEGSSGATLVDIKILEVLKPCKLSVDDIVITTKVGECGASIKPGTTFLFVGDLDFMSGTTHYVSITECSYYDVYEKLSLAYLKLLVALRKDLKC